MPLNDSDVVLETHRMVLRQMASGDIGLLTQVLSDPEAMRYYPKTLDRAGVEAWLQKNLQRYQKDHTGLWLCFHKESKEFVGQCGLCVQNVDGVEEIEVGFLFVRQYWGLGLATEAARGCLTYGFEVLQRQRIIALIRPENGPSLRVADRLGMAPEKETMHAGLRHIVYAIDKR